MLRNSERATAQAGLHEGVATRIHRIASLEGRSPLGYVYLADVPTAVDADRQILDADCCYRVTAIDINFVRG